MLKAHVFLKQAFSHTAAYVGRGGRWTDSFVRVIRLESDFSLSRSRQPCHVLFKNFEVIHCVVGNQRPWMTPCQSDLRTRRGSEAPPNERTHTCVCLCSNTTYVLCVASREREREREKNEGFCSQLQKHTSY